MAAEQDNILVTGANGMLGTDLASMLETAGYHVHGCDLPEVDITRPAQLAKQLAGCAAVINCAAYTDVDGAETHQAAADAVNHKAVADLGRLARQYDLHVIHISTDFVFNGTLDRPYRETDAPRPLSIYGKTKLAGERALAASGCRHAIVRVQWTYGGAGQNFVTKFLQRADGADELLMVADQHGSPTCTQDVAGALIELLRQRAEGLYHYAASGYATRFEVAKAVLEETGMTEKTLKPCRTADFPAAARRPLNSRFDCRRIDGRLTRPRPHWRDSLATFVHKTLGR